MSQVQATIAAPTPAPVKAKKESKPKVAKAPKASGDQNKAKHPTFASMITEAITKLAERSGSSRQAIVKYISANFQVDPKIVNQHVKVALKSGVTKGIFKQSSGLGAAGSFKLGEKKVEKKPKSTIKKPKVVKTVKKEGVVKKTIKKTKTEGAEKKVKATKVQIKITDAKTKKVKAPAAAKKVTVKKAKSETTAKKQDVKTKSIIKSKTVKATKPEAKAKKPKVVTVTIIKKKAAKKAEQPKASN